MSKTKRSTQQSHVLSDVSLNNKSRNYAAPTQQMSFNNNNRLTCTENAIMAEDDVLELLVEEDQDEEGDNLPAHLHRLPSAILSLVWDYLPLADLLNVRATSKWAVSALRDYPCPTGIWGTESVPLFVPSARSMTNLRVMFGPPVEVGENYLKAPLVAASSGGATLSRSPKEILHRVERIVLRSPLKTDAEQTTFVQNTLMLVADKLTSLRVIETAQSMQPLAPLIQPLLATATNLRELQIPHASWLPLVPTLPLLERLSIDSCEEIAPQDELAAPPTAVPTTATTTTTTTTTSATNGMRVGEEEEVLATQQPRWPHLKRLVRGIRLAPKSSWYTQGLKQLVLRDVESGTWLSRLVSDAPCRMAVASLESLHCDWWDGKCSLAFMFGLERLSLNTSNAHAMHRFHNQRPLAIAQKVLVALGNEADVNVTAVPVAVPAVTNRMSNQRSNAYGAGSATRQQQEALYLLPASIKHLSARASDLEAILLANEDNLPNLLTCQRESKLAVAGQRCPSHLSVKFDRLKDFASLTVDAFGREALVHHLRDLDFDTTVSPSVEDTADAPVVAQHQSADEAAEYDRQLLAWLDVVAHATNLERLTWRGEHFSPAVLHNLQRLRVLHVNDTSVRASDIVHATRHLTTLEDVEIGRALNEAEVVLLTGAAHQTETSSSSSSAEEEGTPTESMLDWWPRLKHLGVSLSTRDCARHLALLDELVLWRIVDVQVRLFDQQQQQQPPAVSSPSSPSTSSPSSPSTPLYVRASRSAIAAAPNAQLATLEWMRSAKRRGLHRTIASQPQAQPRRRRL